MVVGGNFDGGYIVTITRRRRDVDIGADNTRASEKPADARDLGRATERMGGLALAERERHREPAGPLKTSAGSRPKSSLK
jgi:hypothetical protein